MVGCRPMVSGVGSVVAGDIESGLLWIDWFPCPNVGQASTNWDLRLYPGACFLVLWQIYIF